MALSLRPTREQKGSLAEWLGAGLQNRLQQFDSARNLEEKNKERGDSVTFLFFFTYPPSFFSRDPTLSRPCPPFQSVLWHDVWNERGHV